MSRESFINLRENRTSRCDVSCGPLLAVGGPHDHQAGCHRGKWESMSRNRVLPSVERSPAAVQLLHRNPNREPGERIIGFCLRKSKWGSHVPTMRDRKNEQWTDWWMWVGKSCCTHTHMWIIVSRTLIIRNAVFGISWYLNVALPKKNVYE